MATGFDFHAPDYHDRWIAQTDAMRAEGPVGWTDANGGYWVAVGYEAVRQAAMNWQDFSSLHDTTGKCPHAKGIGIPPFDFPLILSESDPPFQTQLRLLEIPFFQPSKIRAREAVVQAHADAGIAALAGRDDADLFREFAMPLVAKSTMALVGIDLARWTEFTIASHRGEEGPDFDLGADIDRVHAMLLDLVHERRREPRDDIVSALVTGEARGRRLEDQEVLSMLSALVLGGFDTTSSLISSGLLWLDDHREVHDRLRSDPVLLANAVDEFMRLWSPSLGGARNLTRDLEFCGRSMKAGDRILLGWAAANRDPDMFPDPHAVRLDRANAGRHFGFGVGPHRCLGSELARLMGRIAIGTILAKLPDYAIRREGLARYQSKGGLVVGWSALPTRLRVTA
jgi:cytochrome P450